MWPLERYLRVQIKKLNRREGCTVMLYGADSNAEWPIILNPQERGIACISEKQKATIYVTTQRFVYYNQHGEWVSIYFSNIAKSTWIPTEQTIQWMRGAYHPSSDQEYQTVKEGMVAHAIIEEQDGTVHLFDQEIRRNLPRLVEGIQKRLNNALETASYETSQHITRTNL